VGLLRQAGLVRLAGRSRPCGLSFLTRPSSGHDSQPGPGYRPRPL